MGVSWGRASRSEEYQPIPNLSSYGLAVDIFGQYVPGAAKAWKLRRRKMTDDKRTDWDALTADERFKVFVNLRDRNRKLRKKMAALTKSTVEAGGAYILGGAPSDLAPAGDTENER